MHTGCVSVYIQVKNVCVLSEEICRLLTCVVVRLFDCSTPSNTFSYRGILLGDIVLEYDGTMKFRDEKNNIG